MYWLYYSNSTPRSVLSHISTKIPLPLLGIPGFKEPNFRPPTQRQNRKRLRFNTTQRSKRMWPSKHSMDSKSKEGGKCGSLLPLCNLYEKRETSLSDFRSFFVQYSLVAVVHHFANLFARSETRKMRLYIENYEASWFTLCSTKMGTKV